MVIRRIPDNQQNNELDQMERGKTVVSLYVMDTAGQARVLPVGFLGRIQGILENRELNCTLKRLHYPTPFCISFQVEIRQEKTHDLVQMLSSFSTVRKIDSTENDRALFPFSDPGFSHEGITDPDSSHHYFILS